MDLRLFYFYVAICDLVTKSIISMNFSIIDALKEENINFQFNINKSGKVD